MERFSVKRRIENPLFSMERSGRPICVALLFIYTLNAVFLPYDTFHLKIVSLIVLLAFGIRCWFVVDCEKPVLVYGLFVTGMTIIMSIIQTGDVAGNIRGGYMGFILLLYPIIKYYRIDFEKMLMWIIIAMAFSLLAIVLLDYFKISLFVDSSLVKWINETENGAVSKRGEAIYQYYIFLKTTPMLVIAMPYCFKKKHYICFMVVFLAMFWSGTRANQLVSLLAIVCCMMFIKDETVSRTVRILVSLVVVALILSEGSIIEYFKDYFSRKTSDDSLRAATKEAIIQGWREDPSGFLFGTGYTSCVFDPYRKEFMPIVEISFWNLLRQIGLFPFIMMMSMYIYPIIKLVLKNKNYAFAGAYVGYLAICINDPLLYSTTGMTVLLYMYYLVYRAEEDRDFIKHETVSEGIRRRVRISRLKNVGIN